MITLNSPASDWKAMFDKVNADCQESNESVVPLSDVDYYADQIHNLSDEQDYDKAMQIAKEMSNL